MGAKTRNIDISASCMEPFNCVLTVVKYTDMLCYVINDYLPQRLQYAQE